MRLVNRVHCTGNYYTIHLTNSDNISSVNITNKYLLCLTSSLKYLCHVMDRQDPTKSLQFSTTFQVRNWLNSSTLQDCGLSTKDQYCISEMSLSRQQRCGTHSRDGNQTEPEPYFSLKRTEPNELDLYYWPNRTERLAEPKWTRTQHHGFAFYRCTSYLNCAIK